MKRGRLFEKVIKESTIKEMMGSAKKK